MWSAFTWRDWTDRGSVIRRARDHSVDRVDPDLHGVGEFRREVPVNARRLAGDVGNDEDVGVGENLSEAGDEVVVDLVGRCQGCPGHVHLDLRVHNVKIEMWQAGGVAGVAGIRKDTAL